MSKAVYLAALGHVRAHHENARHWRRAAQAAWLEQREITQAMGLAEASDALATMYRYHQCRRMAEESTLLARASLTLARQHRSAKRRTPCRRSA